ncbi:ribbon-helix-helix protein, CopG family [Limosilactobacillus caecicola]|nr:ribbon-helix-helix protein, CopG family [Limosilactobacillus caecicola]
MTNFTLRLPDNLAKGIQQLSDRDEITKTQVIRDAIKEHLKGSKN